MLLDGFRWWGGQVIPGQSQLYRLEKCITGYFISFQFTDYLPIPPLPCSPTRSKIRNSPGSCPKRSPDTSLSMSILTTESVGLPLWMSASMSIEWKIAADNAIGDGPEDKLFLSWCVADTRSATLLWGDPEVLSGFANCKVEEEELWFLSAGVLLPEASFLAESIITYPKYKGKSSTRLQVLFTGRATHHRKDYVGHRPLRPWVTVDKCESCASWAGLRSCTEVQ